MSRKYPDEIIDINRFHVPSIEFTISVKFLTVSRKNIVEHTVVSSTIYKLVLWSMW